MNILILGSGGREHSLAWAIAQNPKCGALICAPGNAGMAAIARCVPCDIENPAEVVALARSEAIDFTVIGPEAALAAGVADALREAGLLCFGPGKAAAELESSKSFTKEICDACNAPTAAWARFTELAPARAYILQKGTPIVIKADGLAAGKGVVVAMEETTALAALENMFDGAFGEAGTDVVIEEFMAGEEASLFVLCHGTETLVFGTAQDHKRAYDGDKGLNTGGMGAYSPAPIMTEEMTERAMTEIIHPTLAEMAKRGTPFQGVLYAGLMISGGRPRLLEYNVRFGDPECQALMMRLGAQALDALLACAEGRLSEARVQWADDHALTVVMATKGYPGEYATGEVIHGLDKLTDDPMVYVFHAGTRAEGAQILSNGGRVLNITARGSNLREAQVRAYDAISQINWPGGFYRSDIGWRAL